MSNDGPRIMVTGASGAVGRRITEMLLDSGECRVIAGTRKPESLGDLADRGAEIRQLDFNEADTLADRFRDVDRLYIISTDAVFIPGKRLAQQRAAIAGAAAAGVKHIVYASMPDPEPPSYLFYSADHYGTELALKACGVPFTILRNGFYCEITYPLLLDAFQTGEWVTAAGSGTVPYVAREDCCKAAVSVLLTGKWTGETLYLTGPVALSVADMVAIANKVFDTSVAVKHVSPKGKAEYVASLGLSEEYVTILTLSDVNTQMQKNPPPTDDVFRLTGVPALSYEETLIRNRIGERSLRIGGEGTITGPGTETSVA